MITLTPFQIVSHTFPVPSIYIAPEQIESVTTKNKTCLRQAGDGKRQVERLEAVTEIVTKTGQKFLVSEKADAIAELVNIKLGTAK